MYTKVHNILKNENLFPISENLFDDIKESYGNYLKDVSSISNLDMDYGIMGNATKWDNLLGGAPQIVTPLNGEYLKTLGIIK